MERTHSLMPCRHEPEANGPLGPAGLMSAKSEGPGTELSGSLSRFGRQGTGTSTSLRSFSTLLMIWLVVCFAAQQFVIVYLEKPYDAYLALSGYGMKSGHLWELLTYQLFHCFRSLSCSLIHLSFNLAGLWFVGRAVETSLGSKRFLRIYLGAVIAGAVLQGGFALAGFVIPESLESVASFFRDRYGDSVAGSSVGLCGVFATYCRLQPRETMRLFFLIPVKRAHLLWIFLGIAVLLVVIPTDPRLAHLAHLGGLLTGMVFVMLWTRRNRSSGVEAQGLAI